MNQLFRFTHDQSSVAEGDNVYRVRKRKKKQHIIFLSLTICLLNTMNLFRVVSFHSRESKGKFRQDCPRLQHQQQNEEEEEVDNFKEYSLTLVSSEKKRTCHDSSKVNSPPL